LAAAVSVADEETLMTDVGFHPPPALEALLPTLDSSGLQRDLQLAF
jgi:hypothetical protein